MASPDVKYLLDAHPSLKYDKEKQNIICSLTKHEMPATVAAVESYVKGKKFKNVSNKQMNNYEQHKPHIVPSIKKGHLHEMFCTLTLRHIGKTPGDVERHIKGKRFKRALARWQKCKETGERFVPRAGGHRPSKSPVDDNDSSNGGDQYWSDSGDDDKVMDEDDLKDLYPDVVFSDGKKETARAGGGKHSHTDNLPHTTVKAASSDSDSDYDMSVLDRSSPAVEVKASVPDSATLVTKNSKKIKKRSKDTEQTDARIKKKKKKAE